MKHISLITFVCSSSHRVTTQSLAGKHAAGIARLHRPPLLEPPSGNFLKRPGRQTSPWATLSHNDGSPSSNDFTILFDYRFCILMIPNNVQLCGGVGQGRIYPSILMQMFLNILSPTAIQITCPNSIDYFVHIIQYFIQF